MRPARLDAPRAVGIVVTALIAGIVLAAFAGFAAFTIAVAYGTSQVHDPDPDVAGFQQFDRTAAAIFEGQIAAAIVLLTTTAVALAYVAPRLSGHRVPAVASVAVTLVGAVAGTLAGGVALGIAPGLDSAGNGAAAAAAAVATGALALRALAQPVAAAEPLDVWP